MNQAASAGGTRFSSRSGNVIGDLLQDANRSATATIGAELGRLEQFRLGANQLAQLQAEGRQIQGVGLARQREAQPLALTAAGIQLSDFFGNLRQQRIQSRLPQFNPLLGQALQFALTNTQQAVPETTGGFEFDTVGGFDLGGLFGGLFGGPAGAAAGGAVV